MNALRSARDIISTFYWHRPLYTAALSSSEIGKCFTGCIARLLSGRARISGRNQ